MPATSSPTTVPVTVFQNIQGGPQPGVASEMKPGGIMSIAPHISPRMYHRRGQAEIPTTNPISMRSTYHVHTASEPFK